MFGIGVFQTFIKKGEKFMKIKRTGILFTVIAMVAAILVLLPTVILPAIAADNTVVYANNTFDSFTNNKVLTQDNVNFFVQMPSTAVAKTYVRRYIRVQPFRADPLRYTAA